VDAPAVALQDSSLRNAFEIAADLDVDPAKGLTSAEAGRRLAGEGPNELLSAPPVPLWRKVVAQFQDPLIYLLLVAVVIAVIAWIAEGARGAPVDAIVITAVVVANAGIGFVQERRAEDAVAALRHITEATSTVLRDGERRKIPSSELVCGDILVLDEGGTVGADARLVTASALRISEALLTGVSEPVTKDASVLSEAVPLADRTNMVYRGTAIAQGKGRAVVTATGMGTEMGNIAQLVEETPEERTPLEREVSGVSKALGLAVIVIAVVVMIVTALVNKISALSEFITVLLFGVSLAVAAVPEGLPAILSVVLAIGVQRMARCHAVVKQLYSVETLGSATVIASGKTGTLTKNEITIQRIRTPSGEVRLTGVGYNPEGEALVGGQRLADPVLACEASAVLACGSLASNAQLELRDGEWQIQGDPTEAAFLVGLYKVTGTVERVNGLEYRADVPVASQRRMTSAVVEGVLHGEDSAPTLVSMGAPDALIARCRAVQVGDAVLPLDDDRRAAALAADEELSALAFQTLAVAYRRLDDVDGRAVGEDDQRDLVYLGVVGMIDPPRDEVGDAIARARRAGVRVLMMTGDHPAAAARTAADLGIVERGANAVSGAELDAMSAQQMREVTATTSVYARVEPRHKLQIVDALHAQGEIVAMTGEGVNDAPALKAADIGVAMGVSGTDVAKDAANMILGDDHFATIVAAVHEGRVIVDNIKKALRYLLTSNMGEIFTVFFGVVFAGVIGITASAGETVVLPLLATQILWINLVTDSAPALAMGVDTELDDVMTRAPRRITDRIIDRRMWIEIVFIGFVVGAATLATMDIFMPGGFIEGSGRLELARNAGITTLVFAQLFNTFNSRSETASAFRRPFSNRWLWGAVVLAAVLQIGVVQLPFLETAFGTVSMTPAQWAITIAMSSLVLWFAELRKLFSRAIAHRRSERILS
jgi:Ca2+-transporting ATPase